MSCFLYNCFMIKGFSLQLQSITQGVSPHFKTCLAGFGALSLALIIIRTVAEFLVNKIFKPSESKENLPKESKKILPFPPYVVSVNKVPAIGATLIDVKGDGNCFFYSLHLWLQELDHPQKNLSPFDLREWMTQYLFENVSENLQLMECLRLELSEIADQKKSYLEETLQTLKVLDCPSLAGSTEPSLLKGIEFWGDTAATILFPNPEDRDLTDLIHGQMLEMADELSQPGAHVGPVALQIMSHLLQLEIRIHSPDPSHTIVYTQGSPDLPGIDIVRAPNHFMVLKYDT